MMINKDKNNYLLYKSTLRKTLRGTNRVAHFNYHAG